MLWEVVRVEAVLRAAGGVLAGRDPGEGAGDGAAGGSLRVGPVAGRYLEVTFRPFPSPEKPEGMVIVSHDETQSVRYQEMRKEFVANVSHELRTPLTAIKGFAETLKDGALHDPERGPRYLSVIEKHADQLTNLINDLLELSRLDNHADLPRSAPVDVGQAIGRAVELLQPAAERKRHTLAVAIDPHLPLVAGNTDYLERAVANLLDNAIKYTPEGGRISVSASADGAFARIDVTDNGIGIPADDLPRIFERFYRVDRSRSRDMGGTGLGLSIVKHVAQAHRGTVEVSSTPGVGTTFHLKLPLGPTAMTPTAPAAGAGVWT